MNTLQAGLQFVQAKFMHRKNPPVRKKKPTIPPYRQPVAIKIPPQPMHNQAKPPLSFPFKSSLEALRQRTREGLKRMEYQASRINQLSGELETAVLELKAIASQVNRDWRALQAIEQPPTGAIAPNVCEYHITKVPKIQQKPSGSFLLTSRPIDLFKAEREAAQLAQTLRHRATKKRLKG
ncbi:MAG TPA: hypothetical protein DCL61_13890 [Cyanobacteria bacterium UBA12227]|nr:hypothetical protein [Cyanobacteria bacterium UBA12227]HAX85897.1 hypothetical protein [Cyanobacteria bacterium UBA11370]HBY77057.1 hypothetical protein [Cyanobacteria bacterium UBA11148]